MLFFYLDFFKIYLFIFFYFNDAGSSKSMLYIYYIVVLGNVSRDCFVCLVFNLSFLYSLSMQMNLYAYIYIYMHMFFLPVYLHLIFNWFPPPFNYGVHATAFKKIVAGMSQTMMRGRSSYYHTPLRLVWNLCWNNFLTNTMSVALLAVSSYGTPFWRSSNTVLP